jgi:hypothetical protein
MAKKLLSTMVSLSVVASPLFSQCLLDEVKKYDNIEKYKEFMIRRTRKLSKISKTVHLNGFVFFSVTQRKSIKFANNSEEFLSCFYSPLIRCYVYADDSPEVLTVSMNRKLFKDYAPWAIMCIKYINKLQPEYVFQDIFNRDNIMFICYKEKQVTLVYVSSKDSKKLMIRHLDGLENYNKLFDFY